jgi:hypothetical protein
MDTANILRALEELSFNRDKAVVQVFEEGEEGSDRGEIFDCFFNMQEGKFYLTIRIINGG